MNSKKSLLESFHEENELHVLQALSAMVSLCGRHSRELHALGKWVTLCDRNQKRGGNFHRIFKIAPLEHRTPESDTTDLVAEI